MEESGRHYVGQKTEETTKRKSVGSLRGTNLYIRIRNTGTDIETGEDAYSRKQLGPKSMQINPRRYKENEGIQRRDWHEKTRKDESSRKNM